MARMAIHPQCIEQRALGSNGRERFLATSLRVVRFITCNKQLVSCAHHRELALTFVGSVRLLRNQFVSSFAFTGDSLIRILVLVFVFIVCILVVVCVALVLLLRSPVSYAARRRRSGASSVSSSAIVK